MAGESLQQNADRTIWSKKIACRKYRSHTLHLFWGQKKVDHVKLQIPDKQKENI